MKILHLTERYLPFFGGVEINIHEISKRLVRNGFEVKVVCENEKGTTNYEVMDGIEIYRVSGFELIKLKYSVGRIAPAMLFSVVNKEIDIVHTYSYGFFPTWASIFSHKPTVITTHSDPTARIYPMWDMFRSIPTRLCSLYFAGVFSDLWWNPLQS